MSESDIDNAVSYRLSTRDARLVDGWVSVESTGSSGGEVRVSELLDLLRLSSGEERLLDSERTARVAEASAVASRLSPAGERVIDAFVAGEEPAEGVRVLELLDEPASGDESARIRRIERLMEAVRKRHRNAGETSFRLPPPSADEVRNSRRIRFSDLVAIAAVLLVGTAVLFPSLFSAQTMAEEIRCAQNMQQAGLGFSLFARDHDGHLPATSEVDGPTEEKPAARWWLVGDPSSSHSANLFVLVREDYVPLEALACPGNKRAQVSHSHSLERDWRSADELSYSYQLFNGEPPRFSDPNVVLVLADRSPVVEAAMRGETVDATRNSQNHGSRGQNLLMPDFSVLFVSSPDLATGDNIWIPRSREDQPRRVRLNGSERPAPRDAFVGP